MRDWTETYKKFKDSELMKEFRKYCGHGKNPPLSAYTIKSMWGWIVCFAETKGYNIVLGVYHYFIQEIETGLILARAGDRKAKPIKLMNDCTEKFFELSIKELKS